MEIYSLKGFDTKTVIKSVIKDEINHKLKVIRKNNKVDIVKWDPKISEDNEDDKLADLCGIANYDNKKQSKIKSNIDK